MTNYAAFTSGNCLQFKSAPLSPDVSRTTRRACYPKMQCGPTRRSFLTLSVTAMISLLPTRAQGALTPTEAGKTLVAARAMLDDLESLASGGEFDVLRRRLRAGALGSVRAACTVRYSELLGGSRKAAEAAYHELVSALERLDFAALSASRMAAANGASVALQVKTVEEKFDKFLNATEQ